MIKRSADSIFYERRVQRDKRDRQSSKIIIYIINSLVCLFVSYGHLNGWADFKTFLAGDYPWVRDDFRPKIFLIGPKKKFFFSGEKKFFRKFFDFFNFFHFFKNFKIPKKIHVKNIF